METEIATRFRRRRARISVHDTTEFAEDRLSGHPCSRFTRTSGFSGRTRQPGGRRRRVFVARSVFSPCVRFHVAVVVFAVKTIPGHAVVVVVPGREPWNNGGLVGRTAGGRRQRCEDSRARRTYDGSVCRRAARQRRGRTQKGRPKGETTFVQLISAGTLPQTYIIRVARECVRVRAYSPQGHKNVMGKYSRGRSAVSGVRFIRTHVTPAWCTRETRLLYACMRVRIVRG